MTDRITAQDLVNREVLACVSSLVSTLAQSAFGHVTDGTDLAALTEQAFELASPVLDYEEAARQAGWTPNGDRMERAITEEDDATPHWATSWQDACELDNLDPYEWEVCEHWIVSDWLADKLIEQGEKVDKDFTGLCVWARTTTGQAISMDAVIERIHAKLLEG